MIGWASERPAVIWALAAGIVISGAVAFGKLPLATRGTVEFPKLQISSAIPGGSPELIETYLTSPIEGAVHGVRGVRSTSSTSQEGSSSVTVTLDPNTDITLARLAVLERVEALRDEIPGRPNITVENFVPQELQQQPLLEMTVVGPYTPGTLAQYVTDIVKARLAAVPGIASVGLRGGATVQLTVSYDPVVLRQLNISSGALAAALANARQVQSLGEVRQGAFALSVTVNDQPRAVEQIGELPVIAGGGRVFHLADLATIHPEEDAHGQFYRLNGETAVSLIVMRQPGADAIRTAAATRALIPALQHDLPRGVSLKVSSDESEDLAKELRDLILRGSVAFVAVFLVLLVTLRSLRSAALVIASAGIAVAGSALSLYLFHVPANLLTLAGLGMGIGILVQNGLVVVERLRASQSSDENRAETTRRIAPAVVGSTLTTTVALLPFLYLQGNARALFAPFAAAFALALFWSVGTALLFVPTIRRGQNERDRGWPRLAAVYSVLVGATLRWRYLTIGFTVAAVALFSWAFVKKVPRVDWGRGFGEPRTIISASIDFPQGSDPAQVEGLIREFEAIAVGQPGVALVRATGTPRSGSVQVEFTAEGSASDAPWVISDRLTERAVSIAGTDYVSVSKPEGAQGYYNSSGSNSSGSGRIHLLGYSYEGVLQLALDLKHRLEQITRVRDVNINADQYGGGAQQAYVSLTPDRIALGRAGLTARDYSKAVGQQISGGGTAAVSLPIDNQVVDVGLRAAGSAQRDMRELNDAVIADPGAAPVRISDVSRVGTALGLSQIRREDQQYIRDISYDFRGPQKLADRTHKAFMQSITVPAGYTVTDEQNNRFGDDSAKGLDRVLILGIVLVLLAVALVFNSVWAAAMVLLALPMALAGVVAAFWFTGTAFTREAAVGVILVVGLAVNHSILLIDAALEARRTRGAMLTREDIHRAATDRVTMIVLVTLTTLASLAPMTWGNHGNQMFSAIALATAGGTVAGTIGVLLLLPSMLLRWTWPGRARKVVVSA